MHKECNKKQNCNTYTTDIVKIGGEVSGKSFLIIAIYSAKQNKFPTNFLIFTM